MSHNVCHLLSWALIAGLAPAQYYTIKSSSGSPTGYLPPTATLTGDFNGNALPDLIVGSAVFLDPAINGVGQPQSYLPGPTMVPVAACDLDLDGSLDVVGMSTFLVSQVSACFGHGDGTFTSQPIPVAIPAGSTLSKVLVGDLNQDGRADLVLKLADSTTITMKAFVNGGAQWPETWSAAIAENPYHEALADFDGDGRPDLYWMAAPTTYPGGGPVPLSVMNDAHVARGNGSGGFGPAMAFPLGLPQGTNGLEAVVADLDRDGRADVVLVVSGSPELRFLYGSGPLTLEPPVTASWPGNLGALSGPSVTLRHLFAYDIDKDGDVDLVALQSIVPPGGVLFPWLSATTNVRIWHGTGPRTFAAAVHEDVVVPAPAGSYFIPADYDVDGDVDLVGIPSTLFTSVYLENRALRGSGCPGYGLTSPMTRQGDLSLGNLSYYVSLTGARPFSPAAFAVSRSLASPAPSGCGIGLDLAPAQTVLPAGAFGLATTDFAGDAIIGIPLPASPSLAGQVFFSQWFVLDPAGQLSVGSGTFAASQTRTVVLW